ncbi:nitroreductase family deazaflavin-dependent oxidoreductase [Microbacterium ureisolvens]|uniref:nitroreductase family deazaflavin-dependent oxidoreductase n=1 Tax=Microbacterium ureisolvens TaxID=2781186 RepID=UPI003625032A
MSVRGFFRRTGGAIGVWLYRRTDGRAVPGPGPARVLLLTTPGRRSGQPRSTCVAALPLDDGFLVWGTGSGAPRDPHWFRNLRAAGRTRVQAGAHRFDALARELHGAERDAAWRDVTARIPGVARYERKAGRTIPVAILTPAEAQAAGAA